MLALSRRNPWLVMPVLVLFVYGIYLFLQWPLAGNHLYGYISFNHKRVDTTESVIPQQYVSNEFGYDGQFYYRLALDPFSVEEKVQGLSIDFPPWRQQRVLMPVLTWVIARGEPELSAVVMLAINLLAVAGIALVGGLLLKHHGLSPWPALLLAFYPGFAISVERFLSEPLSFLLLLLSLLSLDQKRVAWGGVFLALAVLARESALAAALAMAGIWAIQHVSTLKIDRWKAPGPAYWLPAIVTYIFWQSWLLNAWSESPLLEGTRGSFLGWPFAGITTSFWKLITHLSMDNVFFLLMMLATFMWILLIALLIRKTQGP